MRASHIAAALLPLMMLTGCELLGIESPEKLAELKENEGRAIGSACRHAMRAIEDCYTLNPKALKAAVFTGWREMDEYMRENKIEGVMPELASKSSKSRRPAAAAKTDNKSDVKVENSRSASDKVAAH